MILGQTAGNNLLKPSLKCLFSVSTLVYLLGLGAFFMTWMIHKSELHCLTNKKNVSNKWSGSGLKAIGKKKLQKSKEKGFRTALINLAP